MMKTREANALAAEERAKRPKTKTYASVADCLAAETSKRRNGKMNKYVFAVVSAAAFSAPALAQEGMVHVPFREEMGQKMPTQWEIPVASLQALVDAAKEKGETTAFIGGPVWSLDGKIKPKPGAYLLDDGNITGVSAATKATP